MPNWMTAAEISARYMVGEQKLLSFSARGNLPMLRGADGITRFDERQVAMLFRPRDGVPAVLAPATGKPNLGVLGVTRLGDPPTASGPSLRQVHRRSRRTVPAAVPERKVG